MYEDILSSTLDIIGHLPTPLPQKGALAGITRQYVAPPDEMFMNDNYHFPMGTAYLKLGVLGVAEKAAASAQNKTNAEEKELLLAIAQVYRELRCNM